MPGGGRRPEGSVRATRSGASSPHPLALSQEQGYLGGAEPHFHQQKGPGRTTGKIVSGTAPGPGRPAAGAEWGCHSESSFLESLIPLLKTRCTSSGKPRPPPSPREHRAFQGTCLGHQVGFPLPQPPHSVQQEGHLSEGQEARHVRGRQANHAAVLIHHLSPGSQVTEQGTALAACLHQSSPQPAPRPLSLPRLWESPCTWGWDRPAAGSSTRPPSGCLVCKLEVSRPYGAPKTKRKHHVSMVGTDRDSPVGRERGREERPGLQRGFTKTFRVTQKRTDLGGGENGVSRDGRVKVPSSPGRGVLEPQRVRWAQGGPPQTGRTGMWVQRQGCPGSAGSSQPLQAAPFPELLQPRQPCRARRPNTQHRRGWPCCT